ncbi:MAG: citrate (Si)-synthase [bacterium]|nr:citrate (Si)-synthase [bacterium]
MSKLFDKLGTQLPVLRAEMKEFMGKYGNAKVDEVKAEQIVGGMRGIKSLLCDTSEVDPNYGLIIRGIKLEELGDKLPEEIFWLMLTGEFPNAEELADLQADIKARAKVPAYVWKILDQFEEKDEHHPMAMLDVAILAMEKESKYRAAYDRGVKKDEYWKYMLEDVLDIVATVGEISAWIYRKRYGKGSKIDPNPKLDWAADYAHMMGFNSADFDKLMRLYMVLHCDHESGNVSAHTSHLVASALSDPYYAISAGLNGLAGPLHGLANQECLAWVLSINEKFGGSPSKEVLHKEATETLSSGRVIPGYGHAVLRVVDPRFKMFKEFGHKYCPEDPVFKTVALTFDTVPDILKTIQKIKDPWPNVDAASGSLLYHYGLREFQYYTVLFSVSRVLGMGAQMVLARGMGSPIERPKSVTTKWLMGAAKKAMEG